MSGGPFGRLVAPAVLAFFAATGAASTAVAAPKDAQAQKAYRQALEDEYLMTNFDDAEKRLRAALDTCGSSGCAPSVKAKLYLGLGIVLAGGKGQPDAAREAFAKALELDPAATPDPDFASSDVKKAFDEAKAAAKKAGSGASSTGPAPVSGDRPLELLPVPEQRVNVPVPVYLTPSEAAGKKITRVVMFYRGVSGGAVKELELDKSGRSYRGNVPCKAAAKKGQLELWFEGRDGRNKVVARLGGPNEPEIVQIVDELSGKPPSWPGFAPPDPCEGGGVDEAGSSRMQCVDTGDCPDGEVCSSFQCVKKPAASSDTGASKDESDEVTETDVEEPEGDSKARKNWFSLWFAPDLAMIQGTEVCSTAGQTNEKYVCLRSDESRYAGIPTPGQGNNVNFGFGLGTMRFGIAYERVLTEGLTLGARLGYATGGTSAGGASFVPVHAEGRLGYTLGSDPFSGPGVRPWLFIAGGFAQVDVPVEVQVVEDGAACGADDPSNFSSPCTEPTSTGTDVPEQRIQTLTAVKQAGLGFAGAGAGVSFVPVDLLAISLGLKFSMTVPVVIPVLSPEISIGMGF